MCVFLLYNLECTVSFTLLERERKARSGEDVVVGWSPKICPSAAPRRLQAGGWRGRLELTQVTGGCTIRWLSSHARVMAGEVSASPL